MSQTHKHALWLRPFGDTAYRLKEFIKELSEEYKSPLFEPHVTLLSGLDHGETELIQFTDTLAGALSPFTIELAGPDSRDSYYQSLFLHVKEDEAFKAVQRTAARLFGYTYDPDFLAHLSLMYGDISPDKKAHVINRIGKDIRLSFSVHSLLLIKTEGKVEDWEKIHTAEFKHHT